MPDSLEQVQCIPCETAHRFHKDDINLPCFTVGYHAVELRPFLGSCAGDTLVCVHPGILPVRVALDQLAVMADLCGKGMKHQFRFHRDSCISSHFLLLRQVFNWCWYLPDFCHCIDLLTSINALKTLYIHSYLLHKCDKDRSVLLAHDCVYCIVFLL